MRVRKFDSVPQFNGMQSMAESSTFLFCRWLDCGKMIPSNDKPSIRQHMLEHLSQGRISGLMDRLPPMSNSDPLKVVPLQGHDSNEPNIRQNNIHLSDSSDQSPETLEEESSSPLATDNTVENGNIQPDCDIRLSSFDIDDVSEESNTEFSSSDRCPQKSDIQSADQTYHPEKLSITHEKRVVSSRGMKCSAQSHQPEKSFVCSLCDKRFSRSNQLKIHMSTHTGKKRHACKKCHKYFSQSNHLKVHMRTHTGEKPFACMECDKCFSQPGSLRVHMRTHTGEKPYVCSKCNKRFSHSSALSNHMRTHTGEKPYACMECDNRFSRSDSLIKHMRTHTGKQPYSCTECDKCFSHPRSLSIHMQTHTGLRRCVHSNCRNWFSTSQKLLDHLRISHANNPSSQFLCEECSQTFPSSRLLGVHVWNHHTDKPYVCKECGKRYPDAIDLDLHVNHAHSQ